MRKDSIEKEREISEAIIGGLIGLAFLFLGFQEAKLLAVGNIGTILFILFFFLIVGVLRIYGIILKNWELKIISKIIFKGIVIPSSTFLFPIMLLVQFLPLIPLPQHIFWYNFSAGFGLTASLIISGIVLPIMVKSIKEEDLRIREPLRKYLVKRFKRWVGKRKSHQIILDWFLDRNTQKSIKNLVKNIKRYLSCSI